jgi:uncharacterized Ntn-hydrolase superfamily protein
MIGTAVASAIPAVGAICSFVSQHAAVSTQSFNNYYFGIDGLRLAAEGCTAAVIQEALLRGDPGRELRQLLLIGWEGRPSAFSGAECIPERGERVRQDFAVAGNMLAGTAVLDAMVVAFESAADSPLVERLMRALEAGQQAGGDSRGKQSAAIKVVGRDSAVPVCDLRIDEHDQPVRELRRVLAIATAQLFPFLSAMPTRGRPDGSLSPDLAAYLARRVADR